MGKVFLSFCGEYSLWYELDHIDFIMFEGPKLKKMLSKKSL